MKKKNPVYQPSIIRYPTGKYSYVGSLPESLCDMTDPRYPRPYKFTTYHEALSFAKKQGFSEDKRGKYAGSTGLIYMKKKNPVSKIETKAELEGGYSIINPKRRKNQPKNRIKIVKSQKGTFYYAGDGLWFGRISEKKALEGLASGKYTLWESIRKNPKMKHRKNQSPVPAWEEREAEGKRRAKITEPAIYNEYIKRDRYQASHFMKNMIRALEIGPWNNTIDDWQRYYEAKYILKLRRSKR